MAKTQVILTAKDIKAINAAQKELQLTLTKLSEALNIIKEGIILSNTVEAQWGSPAAALMIGSAVNNFNQSVREYIKRYS